MITVKQLDAGRNNNFDLIRFIAATLVIFSHSYWLTGNEANEPMGKFCGIVNFGSLGLKVFFAISGYLITKSLYRQPSLNSFVWARLLRIFPALLFAGIFCSLVIGPICTTLPLAQYFANSDIYYFVLHMATLHGNFYVLKSVFASNLISISVDVPLWTLPAELFMYFCVLLWGVVLVLLKKQFKDLLLLPLIIIVYIIWWGIPNSPEFGKYLSSWGLVFFLGAMCYLFRHKIIVSIPLLLAMCVFFIVLFHFRFPFIDTVLNIVVIYGIMVFSYHPKLQVKGFHKLGDLSYGLYIYAFPIQQLLALKFPALKPVEHFLLSFPPTLAIAALSWYFVEKPMLGLKSIKLSGFNRYFTR